MSNQKKEDKVPVAPKNQQEAIPAPVRPAQSLFVPPSDPLLDLISKYADKETKLVPRAKLPELTHDCGPSDQLLPLLTSSRNPART